MPISIIAQILSFHQMVRFISPYSSTCHGHQWRDRVYPICATNSKTMINRSMLGNLVRYSNSEGENLLCRGSEGCMLATYDSRVWNDWMMDWLVIGMLNADELTTLFPVLMIMILIMKSMQSMQRKSLANPWITWLAWGVCRHHHLHFSL